MTILIINKLKKALKTTDPISSIKEIIAEYDELHRLAKWRNDIILSGKDYKKYAKQIKKVEEALEENGYFIEMSEMDEIDKMVREYFRNIK